jgi:hypothetical protein
MWAHQGYGVKLPGAYDFDAFASSGLLVPLAVST